MSVSKEIKTYIDETSKKTADYVVNILEKSNLLKSNINYYQKTELLLYNYTRLKLAVKQKQEDIDYIEKNGLPSKSKSIVFYSSAGGNVTGGDRYLELIEKYKAEKIETERDVQRIEAALDKIKDEKYFKIIEMKYFHGKSEEDIAIKFEKDASTIYRNKKRLINAIKTILFPESIKEYL